MHLETSSREGTREALEPGSSVLRKVLVALKERRNLIRFEIKKDKAGEEGRGESGGPLAGRGGGSDDR